MKTHAICRFFRSDLPAIRPAQTQKLPRQLGTEYTLTDPRIGHLSRPRLIDRPLRFALAMAFWAIVLMGLRDVFGAIAWFGNHIAAWLS